MILLCRKHHTTIHQGHWRIRITAPGRFIFTNPRGQVVLAPPPGSTRHLVARLVHLTTPQEPDQSRHRPDPRHDHGDTA